MPITRMSSIRLIALLLLALPAWLAAAPAKLIIKDGDTLAFLGDSITAAGEKYDGYCRMVLHGLKVHGVAVKPVFAGVPGNTSAMMLDRLAPDVLDYKPDWVFLATGVNDIWHRDPTVKIGVFQPKPGMGVDLDGYRRNVRDIVGRSEAAGAKVILSTITPIREEPDFKLNITARDYNSFLHGLAEERSLPIARLNEAMFADIANGRRLTSDGVHPLESGHIVMAMGILRAMGLTDEEAAALGRQWTEAPKWLILGDHQTVSGVRTGGWCHRLLDGWNNGQELWSMDMVAEHRRPMTIATLRQRAVQKLDDRTRMVLLVAPRGDVEQGTTIGDYRIELTTLVEAVQKAGKQAVLTTLELRGSDPSDPFNQSLEPYNEVLREVARSAGVPLVDLNREMAAHFQAHPETPLTFDGKRFNDEGSDLLVEAVLRAAGKGEVITPELRAVWTKRPAYWRFHKKR